jgi:formylglycine-generating enzyme required for sulfatase activity
MGTTTIRMCWIPAGSFNMGSPDNELDRYGDEGPVHQVKFSQGFWLGKYEVTQAQWQAVMGSNPASGYGVGDDYPVYNVSWDGIQEFESALHDSFRLPSESEWEYACRAGTATRFYWGDDIDYSEIGTYAWYAGNSGNSTHSVGRKIANAWGLHDMIANVGEWCEDWYHDSYNGAPIDGSAWGQGSSPYRVLRGNSWNYGSNWDCRSAFRIRFNSDFRLIHFGFRVVASFPSP